MTLSKKQRQALEWRRGKVQQLHSRNYSIAEISRQLKVSERTISNDIRHWNELVERTDTEHMKRINIMSEKVIRQFQDLIKGAWEEYDNSTADRRDKQMAIITIKECNAYILEILAAKTNVTKLMKLSDIVKERLIIKKQESKQTDTTADTEETKEHTADNDNDNNKV